MKQVRIKPAIDQMLTDIVDERTEKGEINDNKQGVVAELIAKEHKRIKGRKS